MQEDHPPLGPQRLQRGDGRHLPLQIGAHRRRDAHAAHGQPREAHQHEERSDPVHEAFHPGRGPAAVGPAHPLVPERRFRRRLQRGEVRALGQVQPVLRLIQRPRLQKARSRQPRRRHDGPRAESEAPRSRSPARAAGPRPDGSPARPDGSVSPTASPSRSTSTRSITAPGRPSCPRQRLGQRHGRVEHHRAGQRIEPVHPLHLRQRPFGRLALAHHRHGAEVDDLRHRARPALPSRPAPRASAKR